MAGDVSQILVPFGFTSLESEIYTFLLQESPATGYKVAQSIGKATANTYKAIESLQQKGAVLVDEGTSRLCRAVPSDELLARLTRDFEWRRASAEMELSRLASDTEDERVYSLRSRAQVIERARHMIGAATEVAVLSCAPDVAHHLRDTLTAAGQRGLKVFVQCSEKLNIRGVTEAAPPAGQIQLSEIQLVVDGREVLMALFGRGREDLDQAVWSKSAYLAIATHRGLAAEIGTRAKVPAAESTPGFERLGR